MTALHLVRRFVGTAWPAGPRSGGDAWARSHLLEGELRLWARMSRPDRRHAVAVARRVERRLQHRATRAVLAAALLHDVGKVAARLGAYGRVVATVSSMAAGRDTAEAWSEGRGFTRRVGLYLRHHELGADMLAMAGSDPLTVAWAREHHLDADEWTLDPDVARALKAADGD
jgi:hypothetical protein